ncbi:MAG TPA: agglutinin biogenesis protein MshP [Albitalea sp.]
MTPRARGFALVSAIFLLVVLGALGALIASLSTTQHLGAARDEVGSRAWFAARAGIDWGAYQVLQGGGACSPGTTLPALAGSAAGFTVVVACARWPAAGATPVTEAGSEVVVYRLTATARTGTPGTADFAERQLTAVLATP